MTDLVAVAPTERRKAGARSGSLPTACVLGEIDLVRALGRAGIGCAVAAVPGDPAGHSRHAVERVEWFDPWDESDLMLESLLSWGRAQRKKPVLFYNGDHDLLLVSRNRDVLSRHFSFVVASPDLVEDLVDKERFRAMGERQNLPVPPNSSFDAARDGPDSVELPYPIVLKPATRRVDIWAPVSGGRKAIRIDDQEALHVLWPHLADQGRMIAQTLIEGDEDRIESYHLFAGDNGEILCDFTGRKIRTLPQRFGDTTSLEITRADDVAELGRKLVEKIGLTGVAKFDFKRDAGGRLWLLEVNPRFNLWHNAGAVAGANIPEAVYRQLTGDPEVRCAARPGITWCHPTKDLKAARGTGMSTFEWLRWARRTNAKWAMSLRDPMPFVRGVLARRLKKKLGRA